ncbi:DUF6455 family protein [Meridianimarinicoccus roseus]|nr:DUF6455 family protein [Meridianimarinicoccus roseus]
MTCQPPKPLGDVNTHFWLVQDMARAAGVDLVEEVREGRLTTREWAEMVQTCRGCAWERDGGCSRWMELQTFEAPVEVPARCANEASFAAFRLPAD